MDLLWTCSKDDPLNSHSDIDPILANFEEPGKIDLIGFMEKNFMFNMPLEKFSYLTGRSLTTFKQDFIRRLAPRPSVG